MRAAAVAVCLVLGGCSACIDNDPLKLAYRDASSEDVASEDLSPDPDMDETEPSADTLDVDDLDDLDADDTSDPDLDVEDDVVIVPTAFITVTVEPFTMGSPIDDSCTDDDDETEHLVTLTRDFEIMENEVRQDEFEALMGYNPSDFESLGHSKHPVEQVTWHEAALYANMLSDEAGLSRCYECWVPEVDVFCQQDIAWATPYHCPGYRLPTEAEWEFAARAGTTTDTYEGDILAENHLCDPPSPSLVYIAWYDCTNEELTITRPVKIKRANDFGLYDMLGNVHEWCHDWYDTYPGDITDPWGPTDGSDRVIRGGCWYTDACDTRCASRSLYDDTADSLMIGFRLVRSL